jgi:hypothetical protein
VACATPAWASIPLTTTASATTISGYVDVSADYYSKSVGHSSDGSLGGAFALPVSPGSNLQFDADYSRLYPGQGAAATNAWDGDVHYTYSFGGIPVGGFLGGFTNNGIGTLGGGIEALVPIDNNFSWTTQGVYAHTGTSDTNLWGGRTQLNYYPSGCDNTRFSANFGAQHSSSTFFPGFSSSANNYSVGLNAEYRLPGQPWSLYGEYEHTHFGGTFGSSVDGFSIGLRYNFGGGSLKDRDTQGPAFPNFSQLIGVGYKF